MTCFRCGAPVPSATSYCPVCGTALPRATGSAAHTRAITVTDDALARSLGADILLGRAFAFVGKDAFRKPGLSWVQRLLGGPAAARAQIISLLDREPVPLPGATIAPRPLPSLALSSVTSDKALYREGRDDVHLLALDPCAPGVEVVLEIKANGADLSTRPARLDARGAAAITLRDLPAGDYDVRLRGAPKDAPVCSFAVATYRLAPLVASLTDRTLQGARLAVTLRLESFGVPVDGKVQLELHDRGARLAQVTADAVGGRASTTFTLSGEGPHAINVQLAADPSRTATVPIVGSRLAERSLTPFSTLGYTIEGSLLPGEGSTAVRGIHLQEGAIRTTPFRLDRVDTARARLTTTVAIETARIVVLDPSLPGRRPDAVDPLTAPHPATTDARYREGEALFQAGKIAEARAIFEDARAAMSHAPHPNYAYFIACCLAREGEKARAIGALDAAIRDGWSDFSLLARDEDLASLRGFPPYEALKAGPAQKELVLDDLSAGESIEIDVPAPMAILAIGAFVDGAPWEGWAATITPPQLAPTLAVPERAMPGGAARIEVDTGLGRDDVSVYLVVKDARLLTPDTPESRLAGGLKALAQTAADALAIGTPTRSLAQEIQPPTPLHFESSGFGALPALGAMPMGPPSFGPPPPGGFPPSVAGFGPPPPMAVARAAMPVPSAPMARPALAGGRAAPPPMVERLAAASPYREAATVPPPPSIEEPEVLFAGLIETHAGKALVTLPLGPDFAEYLVSAFVLHGRDWAPIEARFRAEKEVFVTLGLPSFVHPDDGALGTLHVGSRGGRLRVTRDGVEVALVLEGRSLAADEPVPAGRCELSFLAGAGHFEAVLDDASGLRERASGEVDLPGKLRRTASTVRFLEAGQAVSRASDPSIVGLRILPGLDQPFRALIDATADYGHACCEQTAAKMLSACAMYALAESRTRREKAEAIIIAGVRRETTMWLRGKGFKMYPESSARPDAYWGPLAARYLWNLGLLRELRGDAAPGRALAHALDEGLAMARDATAAYALEWPPRRVSTCEEAYAQIRFGNGGKQAISVVEQRTASALGGGAVSQRSELAYGAAALLRAGGGASRGYALGLANKVIEQIGPEGRLYSTVDSVAAIALMTELDAAQVLGGAGEVELDGERLTARDALARTGEIQAIRALSGVTAVEVRRIVEEDWSRFGAGVPLAVRLIKGGVTTRRLNALDAVELEVKLEAGYTPGDLLWVCLPDALSRVIGGGQVKRFSVDFQGNDTVRVPLAATGITVGPDGKEAPGHLTLCVRNMFEEERGGNPGPIEITVSPPAGGASPLGRFVAALKGALGR